MFIKRLGLPMLTLDPADDAGKGGGGGGTDDGVGDTGTDDDKGGDDKSGGKGGKKDGVTFSNSDAAEYRRLKKEAADRAKADEDKKKAEMTELERERTERAEAQKSAAAAERRALVAEVAADLSLPKALRDRLRGDTREELEADAQTLLELIKPSGDEAAPTSTGVKTGAKPPAASGSKAKLEEQYQEARKAGNATKMLELKRQIAALSK
jgi:hypothetical protein